MNKLTRGMVVDVNLEPTKGSETGKIRPCVVVTNDTYNARAPISQVVPLTAWNEKKPVSSQMWKFYPHHATVVPKSLWRIACKLARLTVVCAYSVYEGSWKIAIWLKSMQR